VIGKSTVFFAHPLPRQQAHVLVFFFYGIKAEKQYFFLLFQLIISDDRFLYSGKSTTKRRTAPSSRHIPLTHHSSSTSFRTLII